jgi:predicted metal-dependent enzyme (double-stranded beta helix superfamily)
MNLVTPKGLIPFIKALQGLKTQQQDDTTNIAQVSTLLEEWVKHKDWLEEKYYCVDPEMGFTSSLVHEEADHSLAVNLVAWYPQCEITPHDHKTWAVVGCVVGEERNYLWTRMDDDSDPEYADIQRQEPPIICFPGNVISFLPDDIHSVVNTSDSVGISLHVYGKNLNYTGRYQYDPVKHKRKPFVVDFR